MEHYKQSNFKYKIPAKTMDRNGGRELVTANSPLSPRLTYKCAAKCFVQSRVFRKGVKAKDFNGHPPNPSGQSY